MQEYMINSYKYIEEGLEILKQDIFSFPIYDDINDESWYNTIIKSEFDYFNNDHILKYMGVCS